MGTGMMLIINEKIFQFLTVKPIDQVGEELAIAMPISAEFGEQPIKKYYREYSNYVAERMPNGACQDSIMSRHDQYSLAKEYYDILAALRNEYPSLQQIHLFIAAQASFVFRLGQQYSSTVHPPLASYNFDSPNNLYDWGIKIDKGEVFSTQAPNVY